MKKSVCWKFMQLLGGVFLLAAALFLSEITASAQVPSGSAANVPTPQGSGVQTPAENAGRTSAGTSVGTSVGTDAADSSEKRSENVDIPWVFIPVTPDGEPTGTEYYVPLNTFRSMYRKTTDDPSNTGTGYFFHSAIYTGTLSSAFTSRSVVVESIRAVYELEVLIPDTRIRFPYSTDEVYISPGSMRLNGEPLQISWENNHPTAEIQKPGRYLLEMIFVPIVSGNRLPESSSVSYDAGAGPSSANEDSAAQWNGFRFAIPAIPNSKLELQVPAVFSIVEFPGAVGSQEYDPTSHCWKVQLGSVPELSVQWKVPHVLTAAAGILTSDELYWWTLGSERATLQCRERLRMTQGRIARLEWLMDSRLGFLPENMQFFTLKDENAVSYAAATDAAPSYQLVPLDARPEISVTPEGSNIRVVAVFARPISEQVFVHFVLTRPNSGSVGTFTIPFIQTERTKITKRWFHVASDTQYQLSLSENKGIPQVSIQEFLATWNDFAPISASSYVDTTSPNEISAFVLDDTQNMGKTALWMVKSQPNPRIFTAQEFFSCLFDKESLRVHYVLQFPFADAIPPLYHLNVPENLNIEKVVLYEGTVPRILRFTRISPTRLGIYRDQPPRSENASGAASRGVCQMELTGNMELPSIEESSEKAVPFVFPEISVTETSLHLTSRIVNIYRTSRVLVDFPENSASKSDKGGAQPGFMSPKIRIPFENAYAIQSFTLVSWDSIPKAVKIRLNAPQMTLQGRTVLKMPRTLLQGDAKDGTSAEDEEAEKSGDSAAPTSSDAQLPEAEVSSKTASSAGSNSSDGATSDSKTDSNAGSNSGLNLSDGAKSAENTGLNAPSETVVRTPSIWARGTHWDAEIEMVLDVKNGLADEIVLEIPSDLTAPFELDPPMPFELEPISGGTSEIESDPLPDEHTAKTNSSGKPTYTSRKVLSESAVVRKPPVGEERIRMVIRPRTAISGTIYIRLTGELRENRLDSTLRNALISCPVPYFPGVRVKDYDVILPVFLSEDPKTHYSWAVEGLVPTEKSVLPHVEIPRFPTSVPSGTDPNEAAGVQTRTVIPCEWKSNDKIQVYHASDRLYDAQLQTRSALASNPAVIFAAHSLFWNPDKEYLGISMLDISPRKSSCCVLQIPKTLELLELHLDSRPVQVEEVFWNPKKQEFQEFLPEKTPQSSSNSQAAARFYRVTLRSLQLPQRLEILYHGRMADCRVMTLPGAPPRQFSLSDRIFHLELPALVSLSNSAYALISPLNGATFFFAEKSLNLRLWNVQNRQNSAADAASATSVTSGKSKSSVQYSNGTQNASRSSASADSSDSADSTSAPSSAPSAIRSSSAPSASPTVPASSASSAPSAPSTSSALSAVPASSASGTQSASSTSRTRESSANSSVSPAATVSVPIPSRPWTRVQLICLEQIASLAHEVATIHSPAGNTDERSNWFENWFLVWVGSERILQHTLDFHPELDSPEIRENFLQVHTEGQQLFFENNRPELLADAAVENAMEDFRQNSLWMVFIRNISSNPQILAAYETGGLSDFYVVETHDFRSNTPRFLIAALYTFLFTVMILLGLRFYPSIPEDVRTTPFWLLCVGSLWLVCGLSFLIGFTFLVLAVTVLSYRIWKLMHAQSNEET